MHLHGNTRPYKYKRRQVPSQLSEMFAKLPAALMAENGNACFNQFFVKPDPNLSHLFPGLHKHPCGILSSVPPKQLAANALLAEVLNLLSRNINSDLLEKERELAAARASDPAVVEARQAAQDQEKLLGLQKEVAAAQRDLLAAKKELQTKEADIYADRSREERVVAWKADVVESLKEDLKQLEGEILEAGKKRSEWRVSEKNVGDGSGGGEDSTTSAGMTAGQPGGTAAQQVQRILDQKCPLEQQFYLWYRETTTPNGGRTSDRKVIPQINFDRFTIRLLPGGEEIDSVVVLLEALMSGAMSASMKFLPKHHVELAFAKKAAQKGAVLSYLKKDAEKEEGKDYLHLWDPVTLELGGCTALGGGAGRTGICLAVREGRGKGKLKTSFEDVPAVLENCRSVGGLGCANRSGVAMRDLSKSCVD